MAPKLAGIPADRVVADIGNSRIKIGLLGPDGSLASVFSTSPIDLQANPRLWTESFESRGITSHSLWAISSVNPLVADAFAKFLIAESAAIPRWYRSAADVPIESRVRHPETAGADRALSALAGRAIAPPGGAGLVIACGTALTIERVGPDGIWQGGTIAPGLGLAARSLHVGTAQIPSVAPERRQLPWGDSTESAVAGGVFWGTVGAARELIARQSLDGWRIWTGGDAPAIAPAVDSEAWIVPNLVLRGLAMAAFGASPRAIAT